MTSEQTELMNAYFDSIKEIAEGEIIKGKIVSINPSEVVVDVGYKSEGIILRDEFKGTDPKENDEVEVYVENVEDEEGKIILSYRKARETKGWHTLSNSYNEGDIVDGTVVRKVKGGYIVNVFGVEGFLPQSLSSFRNMNDEEVINEAFKFQIVKMNKLKGSFIISRRDALRAEKEVFRKKVWEDIQEGKITKGRVKSITNFGAFIDLGGVDGLLHIADMSWKKITHPSEIVAVGDEIQIMIVGFDREKGKISLGLKQTMPDPWKEIEKKFPSTSVIKGRITNIQNYGIFVELEKGIEGLVHVSEVSWTKRFINLQDNFALGDVVEAKVINVDPNERKISLSIRQLEKDPWDDIETLVTIDSTLKGKVSGFGEGCAYVELENGLEGIIYNEDISWTKRISRAQEVLKRSHNCEWKILGIDRSNKKVILGLKQLVKDPWPEILEKFPLDKVVEGQVVKVTNFGIFVKIDEDLEGLVFSGEVDKDLMASLKSGDKLKVKIIKVDPGAAKIGLSANIGQPSAE
ncbi:MAG: S1 RNA-binding domain-containing protein [Candidatus Omnitrophica bacterium]|nr:S1 RNA-binding domain-containing protein [Candidatus Omnitrophota bacterium]MBU2044362.1 S1 RNA-binding domain-containing protein [Candidatus Omnitrophota bacterium]MBU2473793.1 S1 RNA-binding domain-containing protein [Candidatus Omnitrophota bacterium]